MVCCRTGREHGIKKELHVFGEVGAKQGFLRSGFAVATLSFLQMQHDMRNNILIMFCSVLYAGNEE